MGRAVPAYTRSTESSTGVGVYGAGARARVPGGGSAGSAPVAAGSPHGARPGAWSCAERERAGTAGSPSWSRSFPQPGTGVSAPSGFGHRGR